MISYIYNVSSILYNFFLDQMKKYLITGGAGFIGSSLVKRIINDGDYVRILDNQSRGSIKRLQGIKRNIDFIEGDIRNPHVVQKACQGMQSIIHLAAVNGTKFFYTIPDQVLEVGVKGIINVLDVAKAFGIKELVVMSSSEVYQKPPIIPTPEDIPMQIPDLKNPRYSYGASKIISEFMGLYVGGKNMNRVIIVRPHNVYGPDMGEEHVIPSLILRIKKLMKKQHGAIKLPLQGDGKQTRSFVFIDDFIQGMMLLFKKGKNQEVYNIGTMDEISIEKLALEIASTFKVQCKITSGKEAIGGTKRRCPDIKKIQNLGFRPHTSLQQGLEKTIKWYKNHY